MELETIIVRIKNGEIPKNIEEKEYLVKTIERVLVLETSLISQIIRAARIDDFGDDEPKWKAWVTEKFGYPKERRCNLNSIGKMLLGIKKEYPELYEQLFTLDSEKNKAISALYTRDSGKKVADFLRAYNPAKMSRDEVRDAVNECLQRPGRKFSLNKGNEPDLPGLMESINGLFNYESANYKNLRQSSSFTSEKQIKSVLIAAELGEAGVECYDRNWKGLPLDTEEISCLAERYMRISQKLEAWAKKGMDIPKAG